MAVFLNGTVNVVFMAEETGLPRSCPECSYDLSGSPGPRCPECGRYFDPLTCKACSGQGRHCLRIPLVSIVIAIAVTILMFMTFRASAKQKDIMMFLFPALASFGLIVARIRGGIYTKCHSCNGLGVRLDKL